MINNIQLDYRSSKANNENSDYFIIIHINSSTKKLQKDINRVVKVSKDFSVLRKTKIPTFINKNRFYIK